MDIIEELQNLPDAEMRRKVAERISQLESENSANKDITIGYIINEDFNCSGISKKGNKAEFNITLKNYVKGYIPKGVKVVFGFNYDTENGISNRGQYYFLDDDSYIYEFCKHIKDKVIYDEADLFAELQDFLNSYFGRIPEVERSTMFGLIYDIKGKAFKPTRQHSIIDFKGKGNALCTEYALLAQNILSFFGLNTHLAIGNIETGNTSSTWHAFNFVGKTNPQTQKCQTLLADFACSIDVFDINFDRIEYNPFVCQMPGFDENFIKRFLYAEEPIIVSEYYYIVMDSFMLKFADEATRKYYVPQKIEIDMCKQKVK